jgi:hypothetical protein
VSRWQILKYTLVAAMVSGLALSPRLWPSARTYPLVPVWDGLPTVPAPWDWLALAALLATLGAVAAAPRPRLAMLVFVLLAGLWSLWDQTRWQPWFYQYLVMFAVLALSPAPDDPERGQAGLNGCRLIVAAMYFWSGLQKVNVLFANDTYPWLMEHVLNRLAEEWHGWVRDGGWTAAYLECALGLALLVWPLRPVAVVAAVAMHLVILFCLGPWGHAWNTVVWPWNVAMMVFVVVLFGRTRSVRPWHILWPRRCLAARLALVLFGVLPLLNFFGWWDSYLSAALYSGNTPDARVYINQEVLDRLPAEVRKKYVTWREMAPDDPDLMCPYEVDFYNWAIDEMNVPGYPADRVSCGLARRLLELPENAETNPEPTPPREGGRGRVVVILQGRADWQTGKRQEQRVAFPE